LGDVGPDLLEHLDYINQITQITMAFITYTYRVPYTKRDVAGTRYMNVEACNTQEAMDLVRGMVPGSSVTYPTIIATHSSDDSFSASNDENVDALFGLIGWGIATTAKIGYWGVVSTVKVTHFTVAKVVYPSVVFTSKHLWKGAHYVATTTIPSVFSFTKNKVLPGIVVVGASISSFVRDLINKATNHFPVSMT